MPLTLRMIGLDDYTVHEDRQLVGRIRKKSAPTSTGVEAEAEEALVWFPGVL